MTDVAETILGCEIVWASGSHPGRVRPVNEDCVLARSPVFLVADGMGGHSAGDLASAAVVGAFTRQVVGHPAATIDIVRVALEDADRDVRAIGSLSRRGAGSTVTGVALVQHGGMPHWLVFNVGDSRVYRLAGGVLDRLTVDHSVVQEMLDAGTLRPEDVARAPQRNVVTRAIGAADPTADSWLVPVVTGDRLMLCSDGLYRELADESLRAALTMAGRPQSAVDTLISLANRAGGRDNISAVVLDVRAGGLRGSDATDTTASAARGDDDDTFAVRG